MDGQQLQYAREEEDTGHGERVSSVGEAEGAAAEQVGRPAEREKDSAGPQGVPEAGTAGRLHCAVSGGWEPGIGLSR